MTHSPVLLHVASFPGRRRSGLGIQTVVSAARNLAIPINFRTLSHDNSKTQQVLSCTKCRSHAHSISIAIACRASVGSLHNTFA